eukprot:1194331-Prorocentrum_minimum.AAC.2
MCGRRNMSVSSAGGHWRIGDKWAHWVKVDGPEAMQTRLVGLVGEVKVGWEQTFGQIVGVGVGWCAGGGDNGHDWDEWDVGGIPARPPSALLAATVRGGLCRLPRSCS